MRSKEEHLALRAQVLVQAADKNCLRAHRVKLSHSLERGFNGFDRPALRELLDLKLVRNHHVSDGDHVCPKARHELWRDIELAVVTENRVADVQEVCVVCLNATSHPVSKCNITSSEKWLLVIWQDNGTFNCLTILVTISSTAAEPMYLADDVRPGEQLLRILSDHHASCRTTRHSDTDTDNRHIRTEPHPQNLPS